MGIIKNFKDLWYLMPFLDVLTNKISVIFSILIGNKKIKLKIKTGNYIEIPKKKLGNNNKFTWIYNICCKF